MAIRVGIIGAGNMGRTHADILAEDARVRIVATTDVVAAKAENLAEFLGCQAFASVEALLDADVEVVYITTPNTQHVPATLAALEKNIHVFCEKPMATSLEEARQVRQAAQASQAVYQVGHNRRCAPAYRCRTWSSSSSIRPASTASAF